MAAFSSLALLGLGLTAGALAGRRRGQATPQQQQGLTQRTDTTERPEPIVPPPAPAPASQTTSEATRAGQQASQRQRRRATPVSTTQPVGRGNPPGVFQPLSLLGF